ncbi:MbtH family protein [Streptomyces sp. NPDC015125]|uniref:MbtH family protein n=1 Tax=Streptomyces sp. NPDC015125 TaxID=3364938 RepID=UPI0036FE3C12
MPNPFEDPTGSFLPLANHEGRHSRWPASAEVPAGRPAVFGPDSRVATLEHVERTWTDIRPVSLHSDGLPYGERQ